MEKRIEENMSKESEMIAHLRKELSEFSRRAFYRGLVSGAGGNISVRVPNTDRVLITATGVSLGDVDLDSSLLVNLDGKVLENPLGLVPSKETSFHLAVFQLRPCTGAVVHVHPPHATAYSILGRPLPLLTVNSRAILKEVPCVDCALPGSKELCDFVRGGIQSYPECKALLMKEHGILTLGPDLKTAYYLADLVEDTAKVAFIAGNIKIP
jgi:ribulose-5-phosphate 4-epimerase/fuculose-1-phosphate aldolase